MISHPTLPTRPWLLKQTSHSSPMPSYVASYLLTMHLSSKTLTLNYAVKQIDLSGKAYLSNHEPSESLPDLVVVVGSLGLIYGFDLVVIVD